LRDWSNGAVLLARLALCATFVAPAMAFGWYVYGKPGMLLAVLFVAPLAAKLLAKPLIELAHEGLSWLWQRPLAAWNGIYYAFDDVHVRIYEVDGELWFAVADVLRAVAIERLPAGFAATHRAQLKRIPGSALQALPAGSLEALLGPLREPRAGRFLLWSQREVVAPWQKRKASAVAG
jgi:hypothetical protein